MEFHANFDPLINLRVVLGNVLKKVLSEAHRRAFTEFLNLPWQLENHVAVKIKEEHEARLLSLHSSKGFMNVRFEFMIFMYDCDIVQIFAFTCALKLVNSLMNRLTFYSQTKTQT